MVATQEFYQKWHKTLRTCNIAKTWYFLSFRKAHKNAKTVLRNVGIESFFQRETAKKYCIFRELFDFFDFHTNGFSERKIAFSFSKNCFPLFRKFLMRKEPHFPTQPDYHYTLLHANCKNDSNSYKMMTLYFHYLQSIHFGRYSQPNPAQEIVSLQPYDRNVFNTA